MRTDPRLMLRFCQLGGFFFLFLRGLNKFGRENNFWRGGGFYGWEGEGLHLGGDCDMVSVMTSVGWWISEMKFSGLIFWAELYIL